MAGSRNPEETKAAGASFAKEHGFELIERLGFGQDGTVYLTSIGTAVKVFAEERLFEAEWEAYLLIEEAGLDEVAGHAIPNLRRTDFSRWILHLGLVTPPFVLDFARVSLHERSETKWPPDVWAERMAAWESASAPPGGTLRNHASGEGGRIVSREERQTRVAEHHGAEWDPDGSASTKRDAILPARSPDGVFQRPASGPSCSMSAKPSAPPPASGSKTCTRGTSALRTPTKKPTRPRARVPETNRSLDPRRRSCEASSMEASEDADPWDQDAEQDVLPKRPEAQLVICAILRSSRRR